MNSPSDFPETIRSTFLSRERIPESFLSKIRLPKDRDNTAGILRSIALFARRPGRSGSQAHRSPDGGDRQSSFQVGLFPLESSSALLGLSRRRGETARPDSRRSRCLNSLAALGAAPRSQRRVPGSGAAPYQHPAESLRRYGRASSLRHKSQGSAASALHRQPPQRSGLSRSPCRSEGGDRALEEHAPGRVTYEFLRPATLNALVERDDKSKPPVDILHFDGHGALRRSPKRTSKKPQSFIAIRPEGNPVGTSVARGSVKR